MYLNVPDHMPTSCQMPPDGDVTFEISDWKMESCRYRPYRYFPLAGSSHTGTNGTKP